MNTKLLDLYSDYLICSFGITTATGLSELLNGEVSHDQITRQLSYKPGTSSDFWLLVKPYVRQIESPDGVLILDDSIEEKPYTDENFQICWHYDHSKDRYVKGINFLTSLYSCQGIGLPVGFHLITKTEEYIDAKTGKTKRQSLKTKNELYRDLVKQAMKNKIEFKYVLNDIWYASAENMQYVKDEGKDFVMPLKENRKIAITVEDKKHGHYLQLNSLELKEGQVREVYLEGVDFSLSLLKKVFKNEDGSEGVLYLVTSDRSVDYETITAIYQKRWKIEEYHKSLKQNVSLSKSPTQTMNSQTNHFFASLWGYVKLEVLKLQSQQNHFALKARLYIQALRQSFATWQSLKPFQTSA
jgi:hypothetical protein